jgi:hypothetical protein
MVVAAKSIGVALRHRRIIALLPEGHHDEFILRRPAHVHDVAALEVAHEHGPTRASLHPALGMAAGHARGDLGLRIERATNALAKPLGGVISNRDQQVNAAPYSRTQCSAVVDEAGERAQKAARTARDTG